VALPSISSATSIASRQKAPYHAIMLLDLTDDETRALVTRLRHAIEYDPFPYAPRLDP
jgi:hypothetical protein